MRFKEKNRGDWLIVKLILLLVLIALLITAKAAFGAVVFALAVNYVGLGEGFSFGELVKLDLPFYLLFTFAGELVSGVLKALAG